MDQTTQTIIFFTFAALIILEAAISAISALKLYRFKDTWVNIFIGVSSLFINALYRGITLFVYYYLHSFAIFDISHPLIYWVSLFFLSDFIAYVFHLLGHKSRFFWASHVIHHSSEKYNLTTAFRVPLTNFFYRFLFYAPLCLMGFEPLHIVLMESMIYMYNFYLHTEIIRNMGWLELIFNTPSHHRVHHGKDEKYIDKNFGGILIIWDRLFKTFQKEEEPPKYGITKPLNSHNFIKIISHEWVDMIKDLRKSVGIKSALKNILALPEGYLMAKNIEPKGSR